MHEPPMPPEERSTQALGHAQPSEILQHLAAEHERLRKKVLRRRRELERFEADLREIGGLVSARAVPLLEEVLRLDAAIHDAFADILTTKKLSNDARAQIRGIYETLVHGGTISPPGLVEAQSWNGGFAPGKRADRHTGPGGHASAPAGADAGYPDQDVDARHRGRTEHLRELRNTFLALAEAMHPDKVQGEAEKHTRTEAMKELNRAYRDGDLVRLLELERAWKLEGKLDADGADDLERRCQSFERRNALLAEQLAELGKMLRALRRSEPGVMVVEVRRLRRERDPDPVSAVIDPIEEEVAVLRKLTSFVQAFQNGDMPLARFLAGPSLSYLFDGELDLRELGQFLELMQEASAQVARKQSKKRRKR